MRAESSARLVGGSSHGNSGSVPLHARSLLYLAYPYLSSCLGYFGSCFQRAVTSVMTTNVPHLKMTPARNPRRPCLEKSPNSQKCSSSWLLSQMVRRRHSPSSGAGPHGPAACFGRGRTVCQSSSCFAFCCCRFQLSPDCISAGRFFPLARRMSCVFAWSCALRLLLRLSAEALPLGFCLTALRFASLTTGHALKLN